MSWKDDVKRRFSYKEDANKWDAMYSSDTLSLDEYNFRQRRDYTVDYIDKTYDKNAIICDLGCGAGPVVYELLRKDYSITGVDYSFDMLTSAKRRIIQGKINTLPLINGNGEMLPFRDNLFDCVICLGVISYVENYENIIDEIYRILKPNGRAIISYRNHYSLVFNDPIVLLTKIIKKLLFIKDINKRFEIGNYLKAKDVIKNVEKSGLKYMDYKGIGFGPYSISHKKIMSDKYSIILNNIITVVARKCRIKFLFYWATDVNILTFDKK